MFSELFTGGTMRMVREMTKHLLASVVRDKVHAKYALSQQATVT
jgi:hypothetical protein